MRPSVKIAVIHSSLPAAVAQRCLRRQPEDAFPACALQTPLKRRHLLLIPPPIYLAEARLSSLFYRLPYRSSSHGIGPILRLAGGPDKRELVWDVRCPLDIVPSLTKTGGQTEPGCGPGPPPTAARRNRMLL